MFWDKTKRVLSINSVTRVEHFNGNDRKGCCRSIVLSFFSIKDTDIKLNFNIILGTVCFELDLPQIIHLP